MSLRWLWLGLAVTGCAAPVTLRNSTLQVTLQPRLGRVTHIALPWDSRVLHFDPVSQENIGGEFLWTVAHHYWKPLLGRTWPPPVVMDSGSWRICAVTDQMCSIERTAGAPLYLHTFRCYRITGHRLTITQRLTRTAPSPVPVTLWSILQINQPQLLTLPGPVRPVETAAWPALDNPNSERTVVRFTGAGNTAFKLCSSARPAWVEAQTAHSRIVYRVTASNFSTGYPDDNCATELWWNEAAGYAELELLSPERNLAPGETLANEVEVEFFPQPPPTESKSPSLN